MEEAVVAMAPGTGVLSLAPEPKQHRQQQDQCSQCSTLATGLSPELDRLPGLVWSTECRDGWLDGWTDGQTGCL